MIIINLNIHFIVYLILIAEETTIIQAMKKGLIEARKKYYKDLQKTAKIKITENTKKTIRKKKKKKKAKNK